MYALALIRYRRPLEEVVKSLEAHRAYLAELKKQGVLIASGPLDPRNGGAVIFRITEGDVVKALDRIRDNDPYVKAGLVQYESWPWNVVLGGEDLDRI